MHSEVKPHEKIRFRRDEIASLDRLPSALPPSPTRLLAGAPRRAVTAIAGVAAALVLLVAIAAGIVAAGFGDERLRLAAQDAVERLAGERLAARIGDARVAFDGLGGLALAVDDARVADRASQAEITSVGSTRFGLRFLPLLRGAVEIGSVRLGDARIDLGAMPRQDGPLGPPFFDENGLIDVDGALGAVFGGAERVAGLVATGGVDRIELADVEIALPAGDGEARVLRIARALVERNAQGALELAGTLEAEGRTVTVEGQLTPDASRDVAAALSLRLHAAAGENGEEDRFGEASAVITGTLGGAGGRLALLARAADTYLPLGRGGMRADISLSAFAEAGSGKVEIETLRVASGRSNWTFNGAVGPAPVAADAGTPHYRFELVSDRSTVAPEGSPEPALSVVARVAGHIGADARRIDIDQIGVRSGQGEVLGSAVVSLEPGKSPGLELRLAVEDMPVGQAKQLWPYFAASGARNWVLSNVFGGRVETGRLELGVPTGRFGNGVPLGPDEVSGRFAIHGTRFDVAGRIPPVRDASGTVNFRGTDVDIALSRGTAYSPSGRVVQAAGGRLAIRDAHIRPVIGKLDIDVSGTADAIFELASYEPIAVGRFIDLKPDDLAGSVNGSVAADIPFNRDIPVESLGWRVELAYDDLTLARAFEGQKVADAQGTIVVDPAQAVIKARATLNDAPATLDLVEPLGRDKTGRQRRVAMQMDDRARRALAPGLDALLSGPAQVELEDATAGGPRTVRVELDRATLSIPWVGWSKGNGVPATAQFAMASQDGGLELSDFRLDGETFGAQGALSLVDGTLQRARFPSARLNRGDDFSVDVQARGRGYAVTVRGQRIDARSAIKLHMKDSGAEASSGGGMPVTVDLEVASMTGFNGETLSNVRFVYSGSGGRTDRMELSATTAGGQPVGFSDVRDGGARTISMRSDDAGAVLRFLDIYENMEGGAIALSLSGQGDGPLAGQVDARNFQLVNEPRLSSIVSTAPQGDGRTLNQAVRGEIDTSRAQFERGFARIVKGPGTLSLENGIVRGPNIGMSFQGTLYDRQGNMALTGTFMPAYGLNRLFGEIPLIGQILGNGRDRGLIGITFRLAGRADEPQLQINPLSVIAPGIFRSVFEFR